MARFGSGDTVHLAADNSASANFLLLTGVPIGEPVARYGPFVMNTRTGSNRRSVTTSRGAWARLLRRHETI